MITSWSVFYILLYPVSPICNPQRRHNQDSNSQPAAIFPCFLSFWFSSLGKLITWLKLTHSESTELPIWLYNFFNTNACVQTTRTLHKYTYIHMYHIFRPVSELSSLELKNMGLKNTRAEKNMRVHHWEKYIKYWGSVISWPELK